MEARVKPKNKAKYVKSFLSPYSPKILRNFSRKTKE